MIGKLLDKLTYANVVATIALFGVLGGGAYAAFRCPPKRRLAPAEGQGGERRQDRQRDDLRRQDRRRNDHRPEHQDAAPRHRPPGRQRDNASNANTVGGHAASCPAGTTLIRGLCYETSSTEAPNLKAAAEDCATKGGYLPTPMQLYSTKSVIFLGDGVGAEKRFTDDVYSKVGEGKYSTIVIDGAGALEEQEIPGPPATTASPAGAIVARRQEASGWWWRAFAAAPS